MVHFQGRVAARTVTLCQNSAYIGVEAVEVRVHCNANRLSAYDLTDSRVSDEVFLVLVGVVESLFSLGIGVLAPTLPVPKITTWIVIPIDNSIFCCKHIGIIHPTAIACLVHSITVHKVLDRIRWNFSQIVFDGVQTLKRRCCHKCPTSTTSSLVNRLERDFASCWPVNFISYSGPRWSNNLRFIRHLWSWACLLIIVDVIIIVFGPRVEPIPEFWWQQFVRLRYNRLGRFLCYWFTKHCCVISRIKLFFRQVTELIDPFLEQCLPGFKLLIVILNIIVVFREDFESFINLSLGCILSAIACDKVSKGHMLLFELSINCLVSSTKKHWLICVRATCLSRMLE